MKIAVSGCGITGTTVAYFLASSGHDVTIFEQARACGPVGAGIMLQQSGQAILQKMGLLESVASCSQKLNGMTAQLPSRRNLIELDFGRLTPDSYSLGVHRGRLFQQLFDACRQAGVKIRNGTRVTRTTKEKKSQSKRAGIEFESNDDRESANDFDFVIAADGSRSLLRIASGLKASIHDYDYAALWLTAHSDYQSDRLMQVVEGTQKLVGLLPIGLGECSFFWGLRSSTFESLLKSDFATWKQSVEELCPAASTVLAEVDRFDRFTFARYRHVSMKRCYTDHLIVLGDAAHATSPHLGQGANLALEDGFEFAQAVDETADFLLACQLYCKRRLRKIRYYQSLTKFLSPFFQGGGWIRTSLRNLSLPWLPHLPFIGKQMLRTLCGVKQGWFA